MTALAVIGNCNVTDSWETLERQDKPSEGSASVKVFLFPPVFPADSGLDDTEKQVYVDRNFTNIFEYVYKGSGWMPGFGSADPVNFLQVNGPPGNGKQQIASLVYSGPDT